MRTPREVAESYAEIVRWNGKIGDFTSLARAVRPQYGVQHVDDKFPTGGPGAGFNFFVGDTNVDSGFSSLEVDTYDDWAR
jgi:hypothetical protein